MSDATKLIERLKMAQIASCTCMTKSPDTKYHAEDCRYRVLEDAAALIEQQAAELKAASERLTFVASINASYVEEIHALRDRIAELESAQSSGASTRPDADLVQRCKELEELATVGQSEQEALNRLANTYRSDISTHDRKAMSRNQTHREAMRFVIAASAQSSQQGAVTVPDGWKLVPIEPTEDMVIDGFESCPSRIFSEPEDWAAYEAMSGCHQAAHRARLCYAAMLAAAPSHPHATDSDRRDAEELAPSFTSPLTPYGLLVRALRIVAGTTLYEMAKSLSSTPAKLSAIEFGREQVTDAMVTDVAAFFSSKGVPHTLPALSAALSQMQEPGDEG